MKLSVSGFMWWFFVILLTAAVKLGLDQFWSIGSSNLWGSVATSIIAFAIGFGIVGFFRKHETKGTMVGGAEK